MGFFDIFKSRNDESAYDTSIPVKSNQRVDMPVNYTKSEALTLAKLQAASSLGQKIGDAWMESKRINANIEALRIQTNAQVKNHAETMMTYRQAISAVFGERAKALNAHYAALDKALQSNDREVILLSLQNISSIVITNPMEQVAKCLSMLDNPNQRLQLDF